MTRLHREELIPSAARLMSSLRDLGYEFVNAVADIVDNSVAADANRVDISIEFDGPDSWVRIADNGWGMSGNDISEAMRLGTGRTYGSEDLGKFGLGLKTASLSQARVITVAGRTNPNRRLIDCRKLDLDDIIERDMWEVIHLAAADRPEAIVTPLNDNPGTVVLWEQLDRILNRKDPFGGWAQRHLMKLAEDLDVHLGMVFGRFLTGQAKRKRKLTITVNGTKVEPWDPFCLSEDTERLPEMELPVAGSVVRWRPFVLPPQRDFSDDTEWKRAGGPRQWNNQQGLYIYRADRMIQSGGWSRLRGTEEHMKLARASLEFWPLLDEAFEINISKMQVRIPAELREQLGPLVAFLTRRANSRYRISGQKDRRPVAPMRPPSPRIDIQVGGTSPNDFFKMDATVSQPIQVRGGDVNPSLVQGRWAGPTAGPLNDPLPSNDQPDRSVRSADRRAAGALEQAARNVGAEEALELIRTELCRIDPEVADELGW